MNQSRANVALRCAVTPPTQAEGRGVVKLSQCVFLHSRGHSCNHVTLRIRRTDSEIRVLLVGCSRCLFLWVG